ncbi:hypothetical protein [Synechococcus sp. UW69]|uniref:hypothetical protein n=1 Tax=Synechococcus sp. UW69 TaxID=368493 RepID=UPI000E0EF25E|nr:hypothetical protein [Synechococcus sp. UW69]
MNKKIRIEEIEDTLTKDTSIAEFKDGLTSTLCKELDQLNLLTTLIKSRLVRAIYIYLDGIENNTEETSAETLFERAKDALSWDWFSSQTDRHYLNRKDTLDKYSFKLLRNQNKGVILEAQQRIMNQEEEWESVSNKWGIDPEKKFCGIYENIPSNKLGKEIKSIITGLELNKVSEPFRMGKNYAILEITKRIELQLDKDTRKMLAEELFENWLDKKTKDIIDKYLMQDVQN